MVWMKRPDYGLIRACGEDAHDFLQGQLSNDLRLLTPNHVVRAAYCTPQGRVLALVTLVHHTDGILMLLPADLIQAVLKRLQMYVLRARVSLQEVNSEDLLICGDELPGAARLRDELVHDRDGLGWVASSEPVMAWRLLTTREQAPVTTAYNAEQARLWQIRAGLPEINEGSSGQYIPQMLNLDVLEALSFRKGCYTGQEIVARTQHLGRIKRRLFKITGNGAPPESGTDIEQGGQIVGQVLTSAADGPGFAALAVIQLEATQGDVALAVGGTGIDIQPLPYALSSPPA
jgi:folate-binding protein YgfZ